MSARRFPENPILIVDDEAHALQSFEMVLRSGGIDNFILCQNSERALFQLANRQIEVMLLDLWMPIISGEEILSMALNEFPEVPVIIVTGVNEVDTAVDCMKSGAFDYLVKPINKERLLSATRRAIDLRELKRENARLKDRLLSSEVKNPTAFSAIHTNNEKMTALFRYMEAIAGTSYSVIVTGETGTGKELFARAIHDSSGRKGAFVPVNVAGLDDNAFTDTLFGHQKGAFTGADEPRSGLVERAAGGTLFLDEIGDLSLTSQVKLLRFLQEREYLPLGSDAPKRTDARIIVATNQDIASAERTGKFRKDLYYRLCTHHVKIPPLRERADDLPLLFERFLEEASSDLGKKKPHAPGELLVLLSNYTFPGNIRELKTIIFDAVASNESGTLSIESFRTALGKHYSSEERSEPSQFPGEEIGLSLPEKLPTLHEAERILVKEALRRSKGNQGIAATMLGITRQALNQRLKRSEKAGDAQNQDAEKQRSDRRRNNH